MAGKGKRRREKNFLAAHGGNSRLPPPPKLRELEALPSKLRQIMQFKNNPVDDWKKMKKHAEEGTEKKGNRKDAREINIEKESSIKKITSGSKDDAGATSSGSDDNRKRKKKRRAVDLRFRELEQDAAVGSTKKERRKEFLELRKKKHKKQKVDDSLDFPGREEIKFGDIVEAPPKLSFPKKAKASIDASQERIRLQAVEAYRNRRGSTSRLGVKLPLLAENSSL
ncbi:uncharacterized protein M6B38_170195 [Iris pallida]|uniref:Coiled-coil domain-containing protein 137 n=1 Tax=Iris pallida TaxID=29817 RepID=A0AAX6EU33_IRIPA|nr:uncharacterized protein M6B38_170195 [Iris pallida]